MTKKKLDMKAIKKELDKMFEDYDLSKKGSGAPKGMRYIEVVVGLHINENADPGEVIENVDYDFKHKDIKDMSIKDVLTEF
jgi:hypothetical protein